MAKVVHFRLDDRLIHGQIIASWLGVINAKTIVIADDKAAKDSFQSSLLKMACPTTVSLKILTIEDAANYLKESEDLSKTFLIVGNIDSAIRLHELGVDFDTMNVGNVASGKGRVKYSKAVWLTDEEKEKFYSLVDKGVHLIVQIVPSEKASEFTSIVKK